MNKLLLFSTTNTRVGRLGWKTPSAQIRAENEGVTAKVWIAKDVENVFMRLSDEQVISIVGSVSVQAVTTLSLGPLQEVINFLLTVPASKFGDLESKLPDWDSKLRFNGLSDSVRYELDVATRHVHHVTDYLSRQSDFLKEGVRDHISAIYKEETKDKSSDALYNAMVWRMLPRNELPLLLPVQVLIATYFVGATYLRNPRRKLMLMPNKHIKFSESLLGLASFVIESLLSGPMTPDELWVLLHHADLLWPVPDASSI